jgi:hypothetical protein
MFLQREIKGHLYRRVVAGLALSVFPLICNFSPVCVHLLLNHHFVAICRVVAGLALSVFPLICTSLRCLSSALESPFLLFWRSLCISNANYLLQFYRKPSVNFGVFGLCILDVPPDNTDQDYCSGRSVGYDISGEIAALGVPAFGSTKAKLLNGLTKALVLHPGKVFT